MSKLSALGLLSTLTNIRRISATISRKVVFIDTDKLPAREKKTVSLVENETEARLILEVSQSSSLTTLEIVSDFCGARYSSPDCEHSLEMWSRRTRCRSYRPLPTTDTPSRAQTRSVPFSRDPDR